MHGTILPRSLPADATAADHLIVHVPVVSVDACVREARKAARDEADGAHVYVVDDRGALAGVLSVPVLFELADDDLVGAHIERHPVSVKADEDQEHVALTAIRHRLSAVPVVDRSGRFLGIIPASALLAVLYHEHVEDLDRISGVLRRTEHAVEALQEAPSRRARDRLPWLLVGLAGSAVATWVMASFEQSLERRVSVAFFIPGIVYLADAIGTQTEAIAVRGLSFRDPNRRGLFTAELRTGLLLGLALALPVFPAVWAVFGDARLAAAVAVSIVVAGTVAAAVGLAFPYALSRLGRDPALGSGPLATVFQDLVSLIAYFAAIEVLT
jgi:magnesium transporter